MAGKETTPPPERIPSISNYGGDDEGAATNVVPDVASIGLYSTGTEEDALWYERRQAASLNVALTGQDVWARDLADRLNQWLQSCSTNAHDDDAIAGTIGSVSGSQQSSLDLGGSLQSLFDQCQRLTDSFKTGQDISGAVAELSSLEVKYMEHVGALGRMRDFFYENESPPHYCTQAGQSSAFHVQLASYSEKNDRADVGLHVPQSVDVSEGINWQWKQQKQKELEDLREQLKAQEERCRELEKAAKELEAVNFGLGMAAQRAHCLLLHQAPRADTQQHEVKDSTPQQGKQHVGQHRQQQATQGDRKQRSPDCRKWGQQSHQAFHHRQDMLQHHLLLLQIDPGRKMPHFYDDPYLEDLFNKVSLHFYLFKGNMRRIQDELQHEYGQERQPDKSKKQSSKNHRHQEQQQHQSEQCKYYQKKLEYKELQTLRNSLRELELGNNNLDALMIDAQQYYCRLKKAMAAIRNELLVRERRHQRKQQFKKHIQPHDQQKKA